MGQRAMSVGTGVAHLFAHPFMRNAFIAATGVGLASGLAGYFVVLRNQVFTGDALSHVAFTGSLAALAFGANPRIGLFGGTLIVSLLLGSLGPKGRADDVVIGSVFAWVLGLGVLFLSIFTSARSGSNGTAGVNVLFGSIFGLNVRDATIAAAVGIGIGIAMIAIARPLLFATLDEAVAGSRGVPVRLLSYGFLAIVGLTAAEATQAVGALLLLGLLAAPAGVARRLSTRPYAAMWLSASIALAAMYGGLTLSYVIKSLPPSFAILALLGSAYLLVAVGATVRSSDPAIREKDVVAGRQ